MGIILLGSILLGLTAFSEEEPIENANAGLGITLSLLSLLFFGLLIVSEEVVLKKHKVPGPLLAGMEGSFALVLSLIFIPVN